MYFHLEKNLFNEFIDNLNARTSIDSDILEKDYYVCEVLKELAKEQETLKAYFKGGTAVYKILNTMNRFSEDIDLTVEVVAGDSNTRNRNRLKKSALGYKIPGLELDKSKTKDVKQSVTAFYKYDSLFNDGKQLFKPGEIQVESTSFTISEPIEIYKIESILYKFANGKERKILRENFNIEPFEIKVVKLERIFIDKLFAAEAYFEKKKIDDLVKHLYDLTTLFKEKRIQKFLSNKKESKKIIEIQRKEEVFRKGGINENLKIKDFECFSMTYNEEFLKAFSRMQEKYIFKDEYKLTIEEVKNTMKEIRNKIMEV